VDYHAVIAADIKDFTGNTDIDNRMLARRLPQVLDMAFTRSNLDFSCLDFAGQAGDSYFAGIDYHKLPYLIHPLLDHLQDVLAELDAEICGRRPRMRLRVSIHIGPLPGDDDPTGPAAIGKAMNDLHRLLDADSARDALQHTDPDATFVAAVISQRAYEDAIQTGACALPSGRFTPISVHVKQFTGAAWLYVPKPSGQALHRGFICGDPDPRTAQSSAVQVATDPGHARGATASGTPVPTFQIGTAGQVAGTVTGPVAIRQMIQNTPSQPVTDDSPTSNASSGESS
jgi:hypothetical protein